MAERCLHGMDARFCASCNRRSRMPPGTSAGGGSATLAEVLQFLNAEQVRATYGAVGELVGVSPRNVGALLGDRRPEASWVVNAADGVPSGYDADQVHAHLLSTPDVISTGRALRLRMMLWRKRADYVGSRTR